MIVDTCRTSSAYGHPFLGWSVYWVFDIFRESLDKIPKHCELLQDYTKLSCFDYVVLHMKVSLWWDSDRRTYVVKTSFPIKGRSGDKIFVTESQTRDSLTKGTEFFDKTKLRDKDYGGKANHIVWETFCTPSLWTVMVVGWLPTLRAWASATEVGASQVIDLVLFPLVIDSTQLNA